MKFIDYIRELFFVLLAMFTQAPLLEVELPPVAATPKRKRRDTTRFTQYHYDRILAAHKELREQNAVAKSGQYKPAYELVEELNREFGMDKTSSCMANVWNGKVKREDLAVGMKHYTS